MKDGAHTHGHGGGIPDPAPVIVAFAVAACVLTAVEWVAARPWWQLAAMAVVLVLAAAGVLRARGAVQRMRAADQAQITARLQAVRAEAFPQAVKGTPPPAIENHYHVHHHYADAPEAARVIRAIPGTAGDATTEGR